MRDTIEANDRTARDALDRAMGVARAEADELRRTIGLLRDALTRAEAERAGAVEAAENRFRTERGSLLDTITALRAALEAGHAG